MNEEKDIEKSEERLRELRRVRAEYDAARLYEGEDRVVSDEELRKELAREPKKTLYHTAITSLDDIIGGFREGQLVVVSGPTASGKTTLCQYFTKRFISQNLDCLWFTYEVGLAEFLEKMPDGATPFYLPRKLKENSVDWLEKKIIEGVAKFETRVVFIDHLHFLIDMKELADAKSVSLLVGMMVRRLKRIAVKHSIIIFLISHLRKTELDRTKNEIPELDDLRDSSFTAQEADLVLMIWRHREKDPSMPEGYAVTDRARIAVRKNRRTGKVGTVKVAYKNNSFVEETTYWNEIQTGQATGARDIGFV